MLVLGRILILFITLTLHGCIGKVEDMNAQATKGLDIGEALVSFSGIYSAKSVADTKVEVLFYPASGDPRDITYIISYDGASTPITVPGQVLNTDYRGLLKYTVTGLAVNTLYNFNVQIRDKDGVISANDTTVSVSTLSNITANFSGIGSVKNLSGSNGRNSLLVEWPAAQRLGSDFLKKELDPIQYRITLLNADVLTPVSFDDNSFFAPDRIVATVAGNKISQQVNGLSPGTKYYVRVQAVHHGFQEYGANPDYKTEQNSNYILAETLSDDLSNIEIDLNSFEVSSPLGSRGLTSLDLEWEPGTGAIDHYRIYYKKDSEGTIWSTYKGSRDNVCDGIETQDSSYHCKKLGEDFSSYSLVDLSSYTDYQIYLLACTTNECDSGNNLEYASDSSYRTEPLVASFSGITSILNPKNYWALDEVFLNYSPVDLNTGVLDGLLVEVKQRETGPPLNDVILNHPLVQNSSQFSVANFDYLDDTEISVRGIDMTSTEDYCFTVIPFRWSEGAVIQRRESEVVRCIVPRVEAPKSGEFEGIENGFFDENTSSYSISWSAPSAGIYNQYVLYIKVDGGVFNFGEAVAGNSSYVRIDIPYGTLNYTIPFLPSGSYRFGVLSHFDVLDIYSIYNNSIRTLEVP